MVGGLEYLLDTNFIIAVLKRDKSILDLVAQYGISLKQCAYSSITKIELLGFPKINLQEQKMVQMLLGGMRRLSLISAVEEVTIDIKKQHRIELPDAVILGTALHYNLQLLTLDKDLAKIFKNKKH